MTNYAKVLTNYGKALVLCVVVTFGVAGALAIWQHHDSKESDSFIIEGNSVEPAAEPDLRGVYTYPGIGALFVPRNCDNLPMRAPLTLAIFFSAESECYRCLTELDVYRRLDSVFCERGQRVVAVTSWADYTAIDSFLCMNQLNIPLVVSLAGMTFEDMGISSLFGPFKILFDSTLSMIYMDAANNTPESQADFEAAMLWLSGMIYNSRPDSVDIYAHVATFVVYDSANEQPIPDARVTITEGNFFGPMLAWQVTNASGVAKFTLYNGEYSVAAHVSAFECFPAVDFRMESRNHLDTIILHQDQRTKE